MAPDLCGDLLGAEDHLSARWLSAGSGVALLWAGLLAGPVAWALDLGISYAIVQWSCGHHTSIVLYVDTLLALTVIGGGAYASWRALVAIPSTAPPDPEGARDSTTLVMYRARFMATLGLASCALFTLVVIAEAVPRWMLSPC